MSVDPTAEVEASEGEAIPLSPVAPPTATEEDRETLIALQRAGLLGELSDAAMEAMLDRVDPTKAADTRTVELLRFYYQDPDPAVADRRRRADRFLFIEERRGHSAPEIIRELGQLFPELPAAAIIRIGGSDGPLVMQAGEQTIAVDDHAELEEDEVDLSELVEEDSVSVQALVAALNQLLERFNISERLILIRADDQRREAYAATGAAEALRLCREGQVEDLDDEVLCDNAGW